MVVCKFFLQGNCRYGNNCRNDHPGSGFANQNRFGALSGGGANRPGGPGNNRRQDSWRVNSADVRTDLSPDKARPKWILSSYGPSADCPASLLESNEYSPEEVRVRFYEHATLGKQAEADQEAIALWNKAEQDMKQIVNNAEDVTKFMEDAAKKHPNRYDIVEKIGSNSRDDGNKPASNTSIGSPFGQNSSANPFSKPAATSFGTPSQPGGFGSPSTFGKPAFGQTGFGNSGGGFGQPSSTASFGKPTFGSSGFGQPAFGQAAQASSPLSQPSQPTGSFGQPSQPSSTFAQPSQPSGFGQPAFGSSGFGANASKNPFAPASASGGFGQSSTAFGQASQPAAAFGQPSQPSGAFGQTSQQSSGFGQASSFGKPAFGQAATAFGQPSQSTSGFGQTTQSSSSPSPFSQPANTSSSFGQPSQPTASGFGQPSFGTTTTSSFGQPSAPANPFGAKAAEERVKDENMETTSSAGTMPVSRANPFATPSTQPPVPVPASAPVKPIVNTSSTAHPLIGRPPHATHYTQSLPPQPPQKNGSNQLSTYRGQRVEYFNGTPCYNRPDGKGWEKIWFPDAGATADVVVLNLENRKYDTQGKDDEYTNEIQEQYKYLFEEGRFKDGQIPLVPPMREWDVYDF
ncbi:hypothetical protein PV08_07832 [Exophiala spinifera]|uniref:C3H1-type domain-containing protein n=1 Tax=Exophiala spinifera TaxID=91928 RepID=A0A0D2B8S2_9EURO|nr:uncharacterized protein PV08_07832 [Exophiala spinifera]KIW15045.1 hypothetical protein PV08_07832 [Exophiala spinifera]